MNPIVETQSPGGRPMQLFPLFHCSTVSVAYPVTVMKPFIPFQLVLRNGPFDARQMWKAAASGIRAIQQLSRGVAPTAIAQNEISGQLPQSFVVASGHTLGHLLLWNVDNTALVGSCTHFNNATVSQVIVTTSFVYTVVEKQNTSAGQSGDDCDIYQWSAANLSLIEKLSAHEARVTTIAVDERRERRMASGGADHNIFLWDLAQKKNAPMFRLTGHSTSITKVLLFENTLISGGGDGELRLWDLQKRVCLHAFDGHQGQISLLEWFEAPTAATHFHGTLCSACAGGIVRGWEYHHYDEDEEKTATLTQFFLNKAHKSSVTNVANDEEVVVSASSSDGLNFFKSGSKSNFKLGALDAGVRCLALDPQRKLLVAGTDRGQLLFFDYSNFVRQTRLAEDPVTNIAALHPHFGAITSLILERGRNQEWTRIVTASADKTIFKMDFELNRDSKQLGTLSTPQVVRTDRDNFLIPQLVVPSASGSNNGATTAIASLFSPDETLLLEGARKRTEGKPGVRISAMRYCPVAKTVAIATDDCTLKCFVLQTFVDEDGCVEEFLQEMPNPIDLSPNNVKEISEPSRSLCAVAMQKSVTSRMGHVCVIDLAKGSQATDVLNVALPVIAVQIHAYDRQEHRIGEEKPIVRTAFSVIVQLRNGEILLVDGDVAGRSLQVIRTLVREQVGASTFAGSSSSLFDMSALQWPMPCVFHSTINVKYEPPKLNLLYVEGLRMLRGVEVSTGRDLATLPLFTASYNFDILQVLPIAQGSIQYAVVVDSSTAYLTGSKGDAYFEVLYDGGVIDCALVEAVGTLAAKKHRSLIVEDSPSNSLYYHQYPSCCCAAFSSELRVVAFGYRDGMVQLWDVTTHRVFKRLLPHVAPISSLWVFGDQKKLFSVGANGALRVDTIWPKTLRDGRNSPTPMSMTPISAPITPKHAAPKLALF